MTISSNRPQRARISGNSSVNKSKERLPKKSEDRGLRDLVCHLETVPRLKKTAGETSHGDIVAHTTYKEVTQSSNAVKSKKCSINGLTKNRESPDVKQRMQRYRPPDIKTTSSTTGNIILDPPKQPEPGYRRRPATPNFLQQSVQQESVNYFSKGGPKSRPASAPRSSSVDLLHYDPSRFADKASDEYKSMLIGNRRRASPAKNRETPSVFDPSAPQDNSAATVLLPSTSYRQATNKSIEVRVSGHRQSAITRSSSSSSILAWDTS